MKKLLTILLILGLGIGGIALAAPSNIFQRSIYPEVDSTYSLGSTLLRWANVLSDVFTFGTDYTPTGSEPTGTIYWDTANKTYSAVLENGVVGQIFKEAFIDGQNDTGVTITNGTPVEYVGSIGNSGNFRIQEALASSSSPAFYFVGLVTEDVATGEVGKITTRGKVRGIQTDGANYGETWSPGNVIYVSGATRGYLTNVAPSASIPAIPVALVISAHPTNGTLEVRPSFPSKLTDLSDVNGTPLTTSGQFPVWDNANGYFDFTSNISDFAIENYENFWNGTFAETFNALATSTDGITVTMSLEKSGGGDLTMQFSDGETTLDTSPAQTITLTPGTNSSPQSNYVYIPQSTKVLTTSTTGFPTSEEHIKISYFLVPSASYVQSSGVYINQNWNDHLENGDNQGHLSHIAEKVRRLGATYFSGLDANGTDQTASASYFDYVSGSESYFKSTSGIAYQMHRQTISAKDTRTDDIHVVNWNGDAYHEIHNLADITADANGGSLTNKFFNIFVWFVVNKGGEYAPVMINLPTGSYNNSADASGDVDGYDVSSIPREFSLDSSTGVLVVRMTLKNTAGNLTHIATTDLRGSTPSQITGGSMGSQVTFPDNQFAVFDEADETKRLNFNVSGITTGNTRVLTVPNSDGTIALTSDLTSYLTTTTANSIYLALDGSNANSNIDIGTYGITAASSTFTGQTVIGSGITFPAALLTVGGGGEPAVLSVQGRSGEYSDTIATYRDYDGENVFRVSGALNDSSILASFGDYDGGYGLNYFYLDATKTYFNNSIQLGYSTASELLATDASKNVVSLSTSTYPSLTELSYVKGVTSAIQTQLDSKLTTASADSLYLKLAGGTMTGDIDFNGNIATGIGGRIHVTSTALTTSSPGNFEFYDDDWYANITTPVDGAQTPNSVDNTTVLGLSRLSSTYTWYKTARTDLSLTGSYTNQWVSGSGQNTNQTWQIDLGERHVIDTLYYENGHNSGGTTNMGAKNFTLWGSNDPDSFAEVSYSIDTGWTQLTTDVSQFVEHTASDVSDPQYVAISDNEGTDNTGYRYYRVKMADNWGNASIMGVRRFEFRITDNYRKVVVTTDGNHLTQGYLPFATTNGRVKSATGLYWNSASSRFGIGTDSPVAPLDVNGLTHISQRINIGDGYSGTTGLQTIIATYLSSAYRTALGVNNTTGKIVYYGPQGSQGLELLTSNRSADFNQDKASGYGMTLATTDPNSAGQHHVAINTYFNGTGTYDVLNLKLTDNASNAESNYLALYSAATYGGTPSLQWRVRKDGVTITNHDVYITTSTAGVIGVDGSGNCARLDVFTMTTSSITCP